jgi:CBS domain-containing protein
MQAAMTPAARVITVAPDAPALEALRVLTSHNIHELPVIEDGRLVGMLTAPDLLQQIELRTRFESIDEVTPKERR